MMRITLVISSLGYGGAERVMSIMVNYWAERGEDVTVLSLDSGEAPSYSLDAGVKHNPLRVAVDSGNAVEGLFRNLYRLWVLRRAIQKSRPDLVISFVDKTNVLTLLSIRGLGIPVIVSERVDPSQYDVGLLWNGLRRLSYPRADALVCQTSAALSHFSSLMCGKGHAIPNPVVIPDQMNSDAPEYKTTSKNRLVLGMGRLVPQKGFDLLLDAFGLVAPKHRDWSLTILGDGPLRRELQDQVEKLGLTGNVKFRGQVSDPFAMLCQADLFVLSSRFEGFPNALLEAMACGLPVVSFDCPSGPREIIRDGVDGILVPPGDVEALASTLDRLMEDGAERERLAKRAPDVLDRFGLDKVMSKWNELVTQITDGNPGY